MKLVPRGLTVRNALIALAVPLFLFACASTGSAPSTGDGAASFAGDPEIFPPPTGREEALLRRVRPHPDFSLANYGPPVDGDVEDVFRRGATYYFQEGYTWAAVLMVHAVRVAAAEGTALTARQFDQLLLWRAYALADNGEMPEAMKLYDFRLEVLRDQNNWQSRVPGGLMVVEETDPQVLAVYQGVVLQDRSIGHTVLGDYDAAWADARESVELFLQGGDTEGAARTTQLFIGNIAGFEQYELGIEAFNLFQEFYTPGRDLRVFFDVYRRGAQAYVNLGDLLNTYTIYEQLMSFARQTGYRDELTNADFRLYQNRQAAVETTVTPKGLIDAARLGNPEMVGVLLDAGAEPNLVTNDGITALELALSSGNPEMISLLRQAGAER